MPIKANETIKTSKEKVWAIITDIENSEKNITAISSIKILEKPESGFIGFKWEETRVMFGKEATETMWISDAKVGEWYETTALNCGCKYNTLLQLEEVEGGIKLSMTFRSTPQTLFARIMIPLGFLFSGMIRKAFQADLKELKEKLEDCA